MVDSGHPADFIWAAEIRTFKVRSEYGSLADPDSEPAGWVEPRGSRWRHWVLPGRPSDLVAEILGPQDLWAQQLPTSHTSIVSMINGSAWTRLCSFAQGPVMIQNASSSHGYQTGRTVGPLVAMRAVSGCARNRSTSKCGASVVARSCTVTACAGGNAPGTRSVLVARFSGTAYEMADDPRCGERRRQLRRELSGALAVVP